MTEEKLEGGFYVEKNSTSGNYSQEVCGNNKNGRRNRNDEKSASNTKTVYHNENSLLGLDLNCTLCGKKLQYSFLYTNFKERVCDGCYNLERQEKYKLIPKTDALKMYLLQENHLESKIDPSRSMKFVERKNTKYVRYGTMKLFLKSQLEQKAIEIHGSLAELDTKLEERESHLLVRKQKILRNSAKRLQKQIDTGHLRLPDRYHQHKFAKINTNDNSNFDSEKNKYFKQCTDCGEKVYYEKI